MSADVVFLIDVDNTLLDNDRIIADLRDHLEATFGALASEHYWRIFERLRRELGYADYLGALQVFRLENDHASPGDPRLLMLPSFLVDYPFADRLYPHALDVLARLGMLGRTVILSDGDIVLQPRKIQRSGLWKAVDGRVLVYIHKEQRFDEVRRLYPARRYVMIDDKLRILAAMKVAMGDRLVTVFPRQGHYAHDPAQVADNPSPDCAVERIGDLLHLDIPALLGSATETLP
ncbi:MAG: HAD family hydrolase [Pseudomonadota bacterium]|nr:HAD family hydrolase [Pseudomonadota bacterium]